MAVEILGDRYRIVRLLARGGMAEVYLAHDELLDRPVAVKLMAADLALEPSFVERFRREARSAALLNHPNIVSVYDFGEDPQGYYIVMEYVPGPALSEVIARDAPLPPAQAAAVATDIAAALAAAHGEGIVHRDVKPANVLLSGGVTKVADFGIARAVNAGEGLTMPGVVIGTANYLSPEQAQGAPVDHRSDLYSLGMVLYQMLTGRVPFRGDSPVAVAYKQLHEAPPPPSTFNSAVPPALDALVARALAVDPADRPQSADEFRSALLAVDQPGRLEPPATVAFGSDPTALAVAGLPRTERGGPAGVVGTEILPPAERARPVGHPGERPTTAAAGWRRRSWRSCSLAPWWRSSPCGAATTPSLPFPRSPWRRPAPRRRPLSPPSPCRGGRRPRPPPGR